MIKQNYEIRIPLSEAQKRIYYTQIIYPKSSMFTMGGVAYITGKISIPLLKKSILKFLQNNEIFHLRITKGDSDQIIQSYVDEEYEVPLIDFSIENDPEHAFSNWLKEDMKKIIPILDHKLAQVKMIKISENRYAYVVKAHHIIMDGWSVKLIEKQISELYQSETDLSAISKYYPYSEYIRNEETYVQSEKFHRNKTYWNQMYQELPENICNSVNNKHGKRKRYLCSSQLTKEIEQFCKQYNISHNAFFVGAYFFYHYKIKGLEDYSIGLPVLGRNNKHERNTIGMFVNVLPLRYQINSQLSYLESLKEISISINNSLRNQQYPYNYLVHDLELNKCGYSGLYDECVNYLGTHLEGSMGDCKVVCDELYNGEQEYSLQILIREWNEDHVFQFDIDYLLEMYRENEIDALYESYAEICKQICAHPDGRMDQLNLISEATKKQLIYDFNNKQQIMNDGNILELIKDQIRQHPDYIAVCDELHEYTYHELDLRSDALASEIVDRMESANAIIGLIVTHSVDALIGILGILKAGAAFLPVDIITPKERMKYIIEDSGIKMFVTNIEPIAGFDVTWVKIKDQERMLASKEWKRPKIDGNDLAYVIYTSGSTGRPKGVMIEHRSLFVYANWAKEAYQVTDKDVVPLYSSLAFDLTITTLFVPLISGAKIIAYEDNQSDYVLNRILADDQCTIMKLTPSHLQILENLNHASRKLTRLIVGGDNLTTLLAKRISDMYSDQVRIYNEYGPTEATVGCMIYQYDPKVDTKGSVPIGEPATNRKIYILDRTMLPCPIGVPGEIYIGGEGLARGYLHNEEMTRNRFIINPLTGERIYKTGDVGKFISEHCIEYISRNDEQIKLRGHRIELSEIEHYMVEYNKIKEACVLLKEQNNSKYLVAYYSVRNTDCSEQEITSYLSERLPLYMIPSHFVKLDSMPLTRNGKIDSKNLPEVTWTTQTKRIVPATEVEQALYDSIKDVLEIDDFGMNDQFFGLGGDSIKAIQVISKLREKGYIISVSDMIKHLVLSDMSHYVVREDKTDWIADRCEGMIENTPIVQWFFDSNFKEPQHDTQSVLLELKYEVGYEQLIQVINELMQYHGMLRANYNKQRNQLFYNDQHVSGMTELQYMDLSKNSKVEQKQKLEKICLEIRKSIDLEHGLLIQGCLFRMDEHSIKLFLCIHHLVVDAVSWNILLQDVDELLSHQSIQNKPSVSYQRWADRLKQYVDDLTVTEDIEPFVPIFTSKHTPKKVFVVQDTILEGKEVEYLLRDANTFLHTTPNELVLTVLVDSFAKITGKKEISVILESHGRNIPVDHMDVTRTVGWFTYYYPFKVKVKQKKISELLVDVKDTYRKSLNGSEKYMLAKKKRGERTSLEGGVCYNFLGEMKTSYTNFNVSYEQYQYDIAATNMQCAMELNVMIQDKKLTIFMKADSQYITEDEVTEWIAFTRNTLMELIDSCIGRESIITASDIETVDFTNDEMNEIFY